MTDDQIIAQQARTIIKLQTELNDKRQSLRNIGNVLYGIGQPLNDNKLKYTKEQLHNFFLISQEL
jgi:hypothetical protein